MSHAIALKDLFGSNGIGSTERCLMVNFDSLRSKINEHGTTTIHLGISSASSRGKKSTFLGANVLIDSNGVARDQYVFLHFHIMKTFLVGIASGTAMLTSVDACGTLGRSLDVTDGFSDRAEQITTTKMFDPIETDVAESVMP